jgi:phage-related protein
MRKIIFILISIFLIGCGAKQPVELEDTPFITINKNIPTKHHNIVPLDMSMPYTWHHIINTSLYNGQYFTNETMIESMHKLHHATAIKIKGGQNTTKKYEKYLREHGVTASIQKEVIYTKKTDVKIYILHVNQSKKEI